MNPKTLIEKSGRRLHAKLVSALKTLLTGSAVCLCAGQVLAASYGGNGDTGFGGPVGKGTLTITDDGVNIYGTLTLGAGASMNDVLVIYLQTGAGGTFTSTAGFQDNGDGSRIAISGYNGSGAISVLTFASGFAPNYAIALGPNANNYGGVWALANGGANSMPWVSSANLAPLGTGSGPYTFWFPVSAIGLAPHSPAAIKLFGTLISNTAWRSTEAIAGTDTGSQGQNPFTQTGFATYPFDTPAGTHPVTFQVDMSVAIANGNFGPDAGDTVSVAGTFQTNTWTPYVFTLSPTPANTNIYTGTYDDLNPTGTAEQFKFVSTSGLSWESTDNRTFTVQPYPVTLPLVYFDDLAPSSGAPVNNVTFQVDMTVQIALGNFSPQNGDVVEAFGTFQTPTTWASGFGLTNNPHASNTNIYTGTYPDANYPQTQEQFKFAIYTGGGTLTYETVANRPFTALSGGQTLPLVFFNNGSNAIPVTFQVNLGPEINQGLFTPDVDFVEDRGPFSNWGGGSKFRLSPDLTRPGIYTNTFIFSDNPGSVEQFKFTVDNGGNLGWESPLSTLGNNRTFTLATNAQTLPLVYFNDWSTNDFLPVDTTVIFTVNMTNAQIYGGGYSFSPVNDAVVFNGDFLGWPSWSVSLPAPQNNPVGSELYSYTNTLPKGHSVVLTYKYGMNYAGAPKLDNEAPSGLNHIRYIRSASGTYTLPVDTFGTQYVEPSFGNLTIQPGTPGNVLVSWLGRPSVHLQTRSSLASGTWQDHLETDGLMSTNWPVGSAPLFFRLYGPQY